MATQKDPYHPPQTELTEDGADKNSAWKWLAFWCLLFLGIATLLSFALFTTRNGPQPINLTIGFIIGNVWAFPLIVLALSQFWKKYRNARSRVKAMLFPTYLVLFAQVAAFVQMAGDLTQKAT